MEAKIESAFDDPYGSQYIRKLDKTPVHTIDTIKEQRIDLTFFDQKDLIPATIFLTRITGDETTLRVRYANYVAQNTLNDLNNRYAESR